MSRQVRECPTPMENLSLAQMFTMALNSGCSLEKTLTLLKQTGIQPRKGEVMIPCKYVSSRECAAVLQPRECDLNTTWLSLPFWVRRTIAADCPCLGRELTKEERAVVISGPYIEIPKVLP